MGAEFTLEYWELYICDGFMAAIHGDFRRITEIYVPELNLSINTIGESLNIFTKAEKRYKINEGDMAPKPPCLVNTIRINKLSETGKILTWFKELQETKSEKESHLLKLFKNNNVDNTDTDTD